MTLTNKDNVEIVVGLLKLHSIRHVVISPGGTNIPLITAMQDDSFFTCYSVVDERSAVYFAIGLFLQIKEPIATLCTSAQATRNYIPGLTEAYYKRVPILAITMEKHPRFKYQEYMQAPDQTSLPNDSVKKSYELPYITDINDYYHSVRLVNEAILELSNRGLGPVQLCVPWLDFPLKKQEARIRKIERYSIPFEYSGYLKGKKIIVAVGEHVPFSSVEQEAINSFCESTNSIVYTNHLSNFKNSYSIDGNLLFSVLNDDEFNTLKPDILITIGGQTGDYPFYLKLSNNMVDSVEHWRVCEDSSVIDTYDKLTKVFCCNILEFFSKQSGTKLEHSYYSRWKSEISKLKRDIVLPFSNVSIAQYLSNKIPNNSIIQFSILNSLRTWSLFELPETIECYANVGAFGIDGGMSTLIGQSVASDKLCFMVIGDLAFFYDMNSLGIRHIKNNIRILLINNDGGIEFKLLSGADRSVDRYIGAAGHYTNAEGWANSCGFKYLSAKNMNVFKLNVESFISDSKEPIIFEVFVSDQDEYEAYTKLIEYNRQKSITQSLKKGIKSLIG